MLFLGGPLFLLDPTTEVGVQHLHFPGCSDEEGFPLKTAASKKRFLAADLHGNSICGRVLSQIISASTCA